MRGTIRRRPYRLVARERGGRMDVLAAHLASGPTALSMFGFEEEAGLFVLLDALGRRFGTQFDFPNSFSTTFGQWAPGAVPIPPVRSAAQADGSGYDL